MWTLTGGLADNNVKNFQLDLQLGVCGNLK